MPKASAGIGYGTDASDQAERSPPSQSASSGVNVRRPPRSSARLLPAEGGHQLGPERVARPGAKGQRAALAPSRLPALRSARASRALRRETRNAADWTSWQIMSGSRRSPGRLGPFVDGYRARLLELGYSPGSVLRSLAALGHLGRWMDRHDTPVGELNGDVVHAFLEDHVSQYGHLPTAGVMPLLDYLRAEGVVPSEPTRRSSPLHGFVDEYRDWLAVERALSPDTVRGYTRLAHRFLAERVSAEDELGVERLTGADLTGFLLRESTRVRPGSVCCHANQLRQLLRYLSMRGRSYRCQGRLRVIPKPGLPQRIVVVARGGRGWSSARSARRVL